MWRCMTRRAARRASTSSSSDSGHTGGRGELRRGFAQLPKGHQHRDDSRTHVRQLGFLWVILGVCSVLPAMPTSSNEVPYMNGKVG